MKTHFTNLLMASAGSIFILTSCSKENITNNDTDASVDFRSAPASINITTNWAEGATNILNTTALAAQNNTVTVANDAATGRVIFRRWDNQIIGRTNGAGDNGIASQAFAFKTTAWDANVPFAFGITNGTNNGREAIWTPQYVNVGINIVYTGLFATDNGKGDENPTVGIIEVGDFRAIDGDFHENRPNKVIFRKWNGTTWQQIGRTNGAGDDGNLLAFTIVNVRTDYTVAGGKVTAQTPELIPVAKIQRSGNVKRLITDLPGGNIGTAMMCQY